MRFLKSLNYAWQGIKYCLRFEKNFRTQAIIVLITLLCGILFTINFNEWIIIIFCWALVLALEIINTAIEKLSDIVNASIHPVIKQVKDLSAGALLLASIMSFIIGCIIFLPKINLVIKYILK
jgi:undecaprenol kinase/diacylglycerol kinase (ATP)